MKIRRQNLEVKDDIVTMGVNYRPALSLLRHTLRPVGSLTSVTISFVGVVSVVLGLPWAET